MILFLITTVLPAYAAVEKSSAATTIFPFKSYLVIHVGLLVSFPLSSKLLYALTVLFTHKL